MAHQYSQLAFTETVRKVQEEHNSRNGYASMDSGDDYNFLLSDNEAQFIQARDSFYMASVSETHWPYVQHRGGPIGFMRVLDAKTIGFADFSGNRQYISTGNFRNNDKVSLFFMDYPNRRRLKLMGRIRLVDNNDWDTLVKLEVDHYRATVERGFIIDVQGFDWNCPQHITPRFSETEIEAAIEPIIAENKLLKQQLQQLQQNHFESSAVLPSLPNTLGKGDLALTISGIRQLTPRVRAYELRSQNGDTLPQLGAGAHLQIPVVLSNGEFQYRYYSICSNPARTDMYEIAVLREDEGLGGSKAIHQHYQLGQVLMCKAPQNYFQLQSSRQPAILIAGGIGITPIKAMAQQLKAQGTQLQLHYSGRSLLEMPFVGRLTREFAGDIFTYATDQQQRLNINALLKPLSHATQIYMCGPQKLIDGVLDAAYTLSFPLDNIHYEQFKTVKHVHKAIDVKLLKSNKTISVLPQQSILDAVLDAGIDVPFSCKIGQCKSCAVKVISGEVEHFDQCLSDYEKTQQQLMCPCVSQGKDNLVLDI